MADRAHPRQTYPLLDDEALRESVKSLLMDCKDWSSPFEQRNLGPAIDAFMQLIATHTKAAVGQAAEWLLEQASDTEGYTRNSNVRALIPHNWDLSAGRPSQDGEG